jgi:hypothetical protein
MFVYSLPLLFTYTTLGTPFELLAIASILFAALLISAPFREDVLEDKPFNYPLTYYFAYAWNAQLPLWRVFWPFFIILNSGLYAADYTAKMGELTVSSWDNLHFMFFFPSIWWCCAVWRSSENTSKKIWAASARLMTIAVFFEYGLKVFIRSEYPQIFFECQDKLMDYMMCF